MTAAARQLVLPPSRDELLEDAAEVIAMLVDELLTFRSPDGAHKALRSIYSPRGTCETSRGGCSEICRSWADALDIGAGWLTAYRFNEQGLRVLAGTAEPRGTEEMG